MVNKDTKKLQRIGRYRTAWEVYNLKQDVAGYYDIRPVAYYRDAQTALLKACADGYSVRMVLLDEMDLIVDNIRIID